MKKKKVKKLPKKTKLMLEEIQYLSMIITHLAILALKKEKRSDVEAIVNTIIDHTESIEYQYSTK